MSTDFDVRRSMTDNLSPNSAKTHISSSVDPKDANTTLVLPDVGLVIFAEKCELVME